MSTAQSHSSDELLNPEWRFQFFFCAREELTTASKSSFPCRCKKPLSLAVSRLKNEYISFQIQTKESSSGEGWSPVHFYPDCFSGDPHTTGSKSSFYVQVQVKQTSLPCSLKNTIAHQFKNPDERIQFGRRWRASAFTLRIAYPVIHSQLAA